MNMRDFKVVSGFTKGTYYEQEIEALRDSLDYWGIPYTFYGYPDRGSWVRNTMEKGRLVSSALNNCEDDVVWLDADAVVKKEPILFNELACQDIDMAYRMNKTNTSLMSGTVYFRNNAIVREVCDKWARKRDNIDWDQRILYGIIKKDYLGKLEIRSLPETYVKINPKDAQFERLDCVIGHKQASRKHADKLKGRK